MHHTRTILVALVALAGLSFGSGALREHCSFEDGADLVCTLRTLQSSLHQEVDASKARSIRITCNDQFFSESHLKSEHFGHLPFLEELSITSCKMRRIPARAFSGLTNLRKLRLESQNSEWSSVVMEADEYAMHNLNRLEDLSLAGNNIWSLPAGFFCSMPSLKTVNLSGNHLVDIADAGLGTSEGCAAFKALTHLDLSNNEISGLKTGDLAQVETQMHSLDLSNNRVEIVEDGALGGFASLRELSLAGNQLSALPPTLFNQSDSVQKLFLQNNSLTLLPPGVFDGLSGLVLLNLSHNAISSHLMSDETFAGLDALQELDLSHNQIAKVQASTFADLAHLHRLHLHFNKIHTLGDGSFASQASLKTLTLSFNRLQNVTSDSFSGLAGLTTLALDNNRIKEVEIGGGQLPKLIDLALNGNQLQKVPALVRESLNLETLDLGDNEISELNAGDLAKLSSLYGLRLAGNKLRAISNTTFESSGNIHILNLAHNDLDSMEVGAFSQLKELRALRLDNNKLEDINGLVSHLGKLQWFNVSGNRLQWFDYAFIPSSLEWLDISRNAIAELGNFSRQNNYGVQTLRAEQNKIRRLHPGSFPESLESIHCAGNEISEVEPFTFERQPSLKWVDLSANSLQTIYKDALRVKTPRGEFNFPLSLFSVCRHCSLVRTWSYVRISSSPEQTR